MTNNRQFHHGAHMQVGALRKTYGPNFAKGCADNERLSEVLAKDASLRRVIRDHEAGKFEQISRGWKPGPHIGFRATERKEKPKR